MSSSSKSKTTVIGLVGGVAAGKSHVARIFEQHGGVIIDADELGHTVLSRPLNARRIGQIFGTQVLDSDGQVSRQRLGQLVFGDDVESQQRLALLEEVVHPQIHAEAVKQLRKLREQTNPPSVIVIDAPLLLEADWAPMCDLILYIDAPAHVRQQRATQRGWSEQHFQHREANQLSLEEKRKQATHFIDGSADDADLAAAIDRILAELSSHR